MRARMAVDKRKLRLQAAINQFRQHAVESCEEFLRPANLQPLVAAHDGGQQDPGHVPGLVDHDLAVAIEGIDGILGSLQAHFKDYDEQLEGYLLAPI